MTTETLGEGVVMTPKTVHYPDGMEIRQRVGNIIACVGVGLVLLGSFKSLGEGIVTHHTVISAAASVVLLGMALYLFLQRQLAKALWRWALTICPGADLDPEIRRTMNNDHRTLMDNYTGQAEDSHRREGNFMAMKEKAAGRQFEVQSAFILQDKLVKQLNDAVKAEGWRLHLTFGRTEAKATVLWHMLMTRSETVRALQAMQTWSAQMGYYH